MADNIVCGRPDFREHKFGVTTVKKHPKYVFGTGAIARIVHVIHKIELYWYEPADGGEDLIRLDTPRVIIDAVCGQVFFGGTMVRRGRTPAVLCESPADGAVLCGRCHGKGSIFKKGKWDATAYAAHKSLGCKG